MARTKRPPPSPSRRLPSVRLRFSRREPSLYPGTTPELIYDSGPEMDRIKLSSGQPITQNTWTSLSPRPACLPPHMTPEDKLAHQKVVWARAFKEINTRLDEHEERLTAWREHIYVYEQIGVELRDREEWKRYGADGVRLEMETFGLDTPLKADQCPPGMRSDTSTESESASPTVESTSSRDEIKCESTEAEAESRASGESSQSWKPRQEEHRGMDYKYMRGGSASKKKWSSSPSRSSTKSRVSEGG